MHVVKNPTREALQKKTLPALEGGKTLCLL
jgi:hypothetical protein